MPSEIPNDARAISIEGPEALIDHLIALNIEGLVLSRAVPSQSPADILDSPMGGRKIIAILKIVTALLGTGTAAVKLADEVETFLRDNPGQQIVVRDPKSGTVLAQLNDRFSRDAIEEIIMR